MDTPVRKRIFVTVQGGHAELCEDTVPDGIEVEILDFDLLAADPRREISCWSKELRAYWTENHKVWGRCGPGCPCRRQSSFRTRREEN